MRSDIPPKASSSASAGAAPAATDRSEWYLCKIQELTELAWKLAHCEGEARLAEAERAKALAATAAAAPATAADPPPPAPQGKDRSLAFCRYFKAVRVSALVTAKIEADRKRGGPAARRDRDRGDGKTARRKREVKRLIESSLVTEGGEEEREEAVREALDRLDRMEFADDDDRPVGHIVEEICNALGVGFDGRQWTDEELGLGWPGWPDEFAEFRDAGPPPMPPRSGSDGNRRTDGEAGTAMPTEAPGTTKPTEAPGTAARAEAPETPKPAEAPRDGKAAKPPAGSPRRPPAQGAASWYFEPAPFSLKDQISRDCGLAGDEGACAPDIDPNPD